MTTTGSATDIREGQVIKEGRTFFVTDRFGDVPPGNTAALGLYHQDTRFLSELTLEVEEVRPHLLHSSTERNYWQIVELAYPFPDPRSPDGLDNISVQRSRLLSDQLFEHIRIRNFGHRARSLRVTIRFGADFLDIFEVRGLLPDRRRGQVQAARVERNHVILGYRGLDGETRTTTLRFSPAPAELAEGHAAFEVEAAPGRDVELSMEVVPEVGRRPVPRRSMPDAEQRLEQAYTAWRKRCTRFRADSPQLQRFLDRAILDLRMLSARDDQGVEYIDAGIPWYSALFGRDALIAAYQALGVLPELAWTTLKGLADRQGTEVDDWREEEPGKILHELRVGEAARTGEIPHTPYYRSIDATPLWLLVLHAAFRWTGDLDAVRGLWPNVLEAVRWIDEFGDRDGDGYVEYERRSPKGLRNQGWKDSDGAMVHPDGTRVEPPIALVEVQGYVYQAKSNVARLARAIGEEDLAERLEKEAAELRDRFNRDFWLEDLGYYAFALDGRKRPVATVTSNPGHCLWSRIVDPDKAERVVQRLLSPRLSSGWGIRTVAAGQGAYDPIGYHTGSVWPHDNALIAHGMKRYGFEREARQVLDQLAAAGAYFPYSRFPELFCGFSTEEVPVPVQYPVACRPQAWASGAPLLMLRSYGGLSARAAEGRLDIERPRLPAWLGRVEVQGMRVGGSRLDLVFTNNQGVTATQVPRKEGRLDVLIRQ